MTSEKHHPGYVLIPTKQFDKVRAVSKAIFVPMARAALKDSPDV
jgi:hypothetical protein